MRTIILLILSLILAPYCAMSQSAAVYGGNFGDGDYSNNAGIGSVSDGGLTVGETSIVEFTNPDAPNQVIGFAEITYLGAAVSSETANNNFTNIGIGARAISDQTSANNFGLGSQQVGLNFGAGSRNRAGGQVQVRLFINNNRTTFNGISLLSRSATFSPDKITVNSASVLGQAAVSGVGGEFTDGNKRGILNYVDDAQAFNGNNGGTNGIIDDGILASNTAAQTIPAPGDRIGMGVGDTLQFLRRVGGTESYNAGAHVNEWAINLGLDTGGAESRYSFGEVAEFTFSYIADASNDSSNNISGENLALTFDFSVIPEPSSALLAFLGAMFAFVKRRR